jgi:hypothetical protein
MSKYQSDYRNVYIVDNRITAVRQLLTCDSERYNNELITWY